MQPQSEVTPLFSVRTESQCHRRVVSALTLTVGVNGPEWGLHAKGGGLHVKVVEGGLYLTEGSNGHSRSRYISYWNEF